MSGLARNSRTEERMKERFAGFYRRSRRQEGSAPEVKSADQASSSHPASPRAVLARSAFDSVRRLRAVLGKGVVGLASMLRRFTGAKRRLKLQRHLNEFQNQASRTETQHFAGFIENNISNASVSSRIRSAKLH